jgi:VIT1/CCC1 family predicted Fe2+/Mn2+ transporter
MAIAVGVAVASFTGKSKVRTAARQLAIATLAAAVTYGVGTAVGVHTT